MSKLREEISFTEGELASPPEGDLTAFVIFTQLKDGGPYIYAGWLDARDREMAVQFAREHYGQDQKCTRIWAIPRDALAGTEPDLPATGGESDARPFQVFTQAKAGDQYISAGTVEATSQASALEAAVKAHPEANIVWVAACDEIVATHDDDVIWRYTDQSYRLARGYSADVRDKWEKIRAERDLSEYEKDDLKEAF